MTGPPPADPRTPPPALSPRPRKNTPRVAVAWALGIPAAVLFLSGSQYFFLPGLRGNGVLMWVWAAGLAAGAWAAGRR